MKLFGHAPDGTPVHLHTLANGNGVVATICTYGGIVTSLRVHDRNGTLDDVVLGYDDLASYIASSPYFGAIIGRYANRIGRARFGLDGVVHTLAANNGPNTLHGGLKGFDKVVWAAAPRVAGSGEPLSLSYTSVDGEEGFPGTLSVQAVYELTADDALRLTLTATTDKDTVVNLTQHSYFNLAGLGDGGGQGVADVLGHIVRIDADAFTPVDSTLIPTGELRQVAGTPFDFRTPVAIGARIGADDEQLKFGLGYDHNWVIRKAADQLGIMARVHEPRSGRVLEVLSTQPGMQFYTGNFLDGTITGKRGVAYRHRSGFCMEPQHFPDSPNQAGFPSVVLKPGQVYRQTIAYRFSVE